MLGSVVVFQPQGLNPKFIQASPTEVKKLSHTLISAEPKKVSFNYKTNSKRQNKGT